MGAVRRKRQPTFESLEGRALLSTVGTMAVQVPAQVQTVSLNDKLYAISKRVLDTVYNGVKNVLNQQYIKAVQTGNTNRADSLQQTLTQVTAWYNQDLAALQQHFGVS